ncbi:MAG: WYL domain-containing protein [Pirellulaceae bacterium]
MLLKLLAATTQGRAVRELADEMSVSEKTIRRDLAVLTDAGFPIEDKTGEFGRKAWRIAPSWSPSQMAFTFDEALALYLGRQFLEPLAGTLFWQSAQRAMNKIRATLTPSALRYVDRAAEVLYHTAFGASDYSRKADLIDALMVAIEDRHAVFLTYRSQRATEPVTYDAYPYGLTYHRGSLYLVGRAPQHDEIRHWKVDRIEVVEPAELQFSRPSGFNLRRHFADSFGIWDGRGRIAVRIRFSADVARYVEESTWHASQKLQRQHDGTLIATFRLSAIEEIKSWILSFGRHADVLGPPELREEIATELQTLLMRYTSTLEPQLDEPTDHISRRHRPSKR